MNYSATLTAQLSALSTALGDSDTDLQAILDVLVDDLSGPVPSFIGLALTQQFDGFAVTLHAIDADPTRRACSSLAIPLDLVGPDEGGAANRRSRRADEPECRVMFFACGAGAFDALAAEIRGVTGPDPRVVVDGPLPPPMPTSGVAGLADLTDVNRAVGVLITRGFLPEEARAELRRRAGAGLVSVPDVARRVLSTTNAPRQRVTIPVPTKDRHHRPLSTGPGRPRR